MCGIKSLLRYSNSTEAISQLEREAHMDKVQFDYSRLRGKIVERYKTLKNFADETHQSVSSVNLRINGIREFKSTDIFNWANYLGIPDSEISDYFFAKNVAK